MLGHGMSLRTKLGPSPVHFGSGRSISGQSMSSPSVADIAAALCSMIGREWALKVADLIVRRAYPKGLYAAVMVFIWGRKERDK